MSLSNPPSSELSGDFRTLFRFFVPILFMALAGSVTPFIERVLFGRLSPEILTASVNVNMITRIFQITFVYLASLTQVYVGRWYGAREYHRIGAGVWQLIWFSLFSTLVTLPMGFCIGTFYFNQGEIALSARPYLYTYMGINFLFPLRATLTGFYLGQGKASWITYWSIGAEALQLILSWILILGVPGLLKPFGLMGGAISHLIIQGALCCFLFVDFVSAHSHSIYQTKEWKWQPKLFLRLVKPGFFRVTTQLLQAPSWAVISRLMTQLGHPYDPVLSTGITLFYFLACISVGIQTSMMSFHSQFIGAKTYEMINQSLRSSYQLILMIFVTLAIPMLLFSKSIYGFLFPKISLDLALMQTLPKLIWMCLLTSAISSAFTGTLLAFKDTRFLILAGVWSAVYDLGICAYLGMSVLRISPLYFWLMISTGHILINCVYYKRMRQQQQTLYRLSSTHT